VSNSVFDISQQVLVWRRVWEEVPQGIKHHELIMIRLDIFAQNIKHQPEMRGKITMKDKINDD
jgi:hypothetical protein